jgi:four helix bundle protein
MGTEGKPAGGIDVSGDGLLPHERLDVFRVARELAGYVAKLLRERQMPPEIRSQLRRSSVSVMSNIAEAAGKSSKPDQRRFFATARGSACEAAAQLDLLRIMGVVLATEFDHAHRLIVRVVQMLTRLCVDRAQSH